MKKTFLNKLLAPIGKGIIIFAVFGLSLYAYASVNFPTSDPSTVTGVVGQFVGLSSSTVDGSRGGYNGANNQCDSGSHICIAEEITRSYVNGNLSIITATGMAWINNGPPGYVENLSNDCNGWKSNSPAMYGSVVNFDRGVPFIDDSFYIQPCIASYAFACCK